MEPVQPEVWICGKPRFIRDAMAKVLAQEFENLPARTIPNLEPPELRLTHNVSWLIWFLNNHANAGQALEKLPSEPYVTNVLMIQGDGHALVRRADQDTQSQNDISLNQVLELVKPAASGTKNSLN
jgi:hypothetical protein